MSGAVNRRDALIGIATTAALTSTAQPAGRSVDRHDWNAAMANLAIATRQSDALEPRVDAVNAAYAEQSQAIPHATIHVGNLGRSMSTSSEWDVRHARSQQKRLGYLEDLPGNYDEYRAYHALIKADEARKAKLTQLDQRLGWSEINDRYDTMSDGIVEAERALLDMPAPDGEALLWKVNKLYKPGEGCWSDGVEDQTHSDLRRFLSHGRA